MNKTTRWVVSLALFALIAAASIFLVWRGLYGWTLFVALPVLAGALTCWVELPKNSSDAAIRGARTGALGCLLFLGLGLEGIVCIAMALPIAVPLSMMGSLLFYWSGRWVSSRRAATAMLLIPASFAVDVTATPPTYSVSTDVVVTAPPELVWKHVVSFSRIPEPTEWIFRTGLAYPQRARIVGTRAGAVRYCEFTTGPFVEPIEVWDEPHLLKFSVTSNPAPMNELGLYGPIHPKHLDGYFVSKEGQIQLTPLPGGRTLLEGTTWYQHGLWPSEYWRLWSDAIIHRIHLRVLNHIRTLAEHDRVKG